MLHSLFYLETALHVSGGTNSHHQERKQLYLQHLVFVTPLLLSAAIVEKLELQWFCLISNLSQTLFDGLWNYQGHMSNILLLDNRSWFWSLASSSQSLGMELFCALYSQLY